MKRLSQVLIALAMLVSAAKFSSSEPASDQAAGAEPLRHFLFIGEPNADAWKWLIENPGDRQALMAKPIEKLGGKLLAYYWGLGNGRNYIIVALPDDPELIQATYVARLGDGLLVSYEMIELLSSSEMAGALKRVADVKQAESGK